MQPKFTIIYAFRNRDEDRVRCSLASLSRQKTQNFEVQFVDYGSQDKYSEAVQNVVEAFSFATYHYIAHEGLLWNKSKALNYGIQKATGDYIFIADVDIIFHPDTTTLFDQISNDDKAFLFTLSYLEKNSSENLDHSTPFESLPIKHSGNVNGMILVSKKTLRSIYGYDNFFHFYGSEDVDLYERLRNKGLSILNRDEMYFKHIWHEIYNNYDDTQMSLVPRLYNVKRINQEHFNFNKAQKLSKPMRQENWEYVILKQDLKALKNPDVTIQLSNVHAEVVHFFEFELERYKDRVVKTVIKEDNYYHSLKFKAKKILNKPSVSYMSIKDINDLVLSKILYKYRDHNYSYDIASDLKSISFTIKIE